MKKLPKYLAELFGTFGLALAVSLAAAGSYLPTPVIAALTLGLFVYTIGHISGTHLNPAITAGALSIGKIRWQEAIGYWVAQFLGAGLAFYLSGQLVEPLVLATDTEILTGAGEALSHLLLFWSSCCDLWTSSQRPHRSSGGRFSRSWNFLGGASFQWNFKSAVALALGSFNWVYLLGPVVGAVLGMWLFKLISEEK